MRLKGKTAIITGSGQGIGEAIARKFAAEGAGVIINDMNVETGEKTAKAIVDSGGKAAFVRGDVTKLADNQAMVDAALKQFGWLDCIVCNAGVTHWNKPMMEVTEDEFDKIFAVNVKGLF